MKIPEALLEKWNDLRTHGDGVKISELYSDVTTSDVSRAFTSGECSDETFEAMAEYYKEKNSLIQQYLKK